jgi:hypothetical protein
MPQGETINGNATDDTLMVDQGRRSCLQQIEFDDMFQETLVQDQF